MQGWLRGGGRDLRQRLAVNVGIHLGELEQVLAVIAAPGMIVGGVRQPEIRFWQVTGLPKQVGIRRIADGGHGGRQHDDGAVQAHLDLQVALGSAVIGACPRRRGRELVLHRSARRRLRRQQARHAARRRYRKAGKQDRGIAGRVGQLIRKDHRDRIPFVDDQRGAGHLHRRAGRVGDRPRRSAIGRAEAAVSPGVNRLPVRLVEESGLRRQVENRAGGAAGDARSRGLHRSRDQQGGRHHDQGKQSVHGGRLFHRRCAHGRSLIDTDLGHQATEVLGVV